jgi:hypothetical protein
MVDNNFKKIEEGNEEAPKPQRNGSSKLTLSGTHANKYVSGESLSPPEN